jgi:hypothetical protein
MNKNLRDNRQITFASCATRDKKVRVTIFMSILLFWKKSVHSQLSKNFRLFQNILPYKNDEPYWNFVNIWRIKMTKFQDISLDVYNCYSGFPYDISTQVCRYEHMSLLFLFCLKILMVIVRMHDFHELLPSYPFQWYGDGLFRPYYFSEDLLYGRLLPFYNSNNDNNNKNNNNKY